MDATESYNKPVALHGTAADLCTVYTSSQYTLSPDFGKALRSFYYRHSLLHPNTRLRCYFKSVNNVCVTIKQNKDVLNHKIRIVLNILIQDTQILVNLVIYTEGSSMIDKVCTKR